MRTLVALTVMLFTTNAMATAVETSTISVPCQWVVDVSTTIYHGIPESAESFISSEPYCDPYKTDNVDAELACLKAMIEDILRHIRSGQDIGRQFGGFDIHVWPFTSDGDLPSPCNGQTTPLSVIAVP